MGINGLVYLFIIFVYLIAQLTHCDESSNTDIPQNLSITRIRRQTRNSDSLLTVEWEGIQSGDHPDSSIRGFIVEYRAEKESQWNVHSGVIPYKGPNHQYRVQIPKLPTGISYFVRIKVLGEKNEVLVETPEIQARNEIVSIKCEADEMTAPRNVDVKERSSYSLALAWQAPECGSVGEYQIELRGRENQVFDVHRQTVAQPSASITGLLSGTEYAVRIRAVDRSRALGPWNEELVSVSTKGDLPEVSEDISVEYKSDKEARIRWKHLDDERLHYYTVVLAELDAQGIAQHFERTRIAPQQDNFLFGELKPKTEYKVGVMAYVDHEPRRIYRLTFSTTNKPGIQLDLRPVVVKEGQQHYQIHWKLPEGLTNVRKFLVEYRPNNDSKWLRVSDQRDFTDEQDSYSVSAPELFNAFSCRVVFIDGEQNAIANSKEVLINEGEGMLCNGIKGIVKAIMVETTPSSLTFSWKKPECDQNTTPIVGYEYAIWRQDDGEPPETTSFTEKESVTIEDLQPNTVFLFRLRSRLTNGHSQWSSVVEGLTVEKEGGKNLYRLRIVLAPPKSYLVWTPLIEHRNNIANFKLAYKEVSEISWTTIVKPPEFFRCPENIADTNDFCYDLHDLDYGKQYTSTLIYELRNDEWTSHGSPLLFILVEAPDSSEASRPNSLRITTIDSNSIEVHWLPPKSSANIDAYEVTAQEISQTGRGKIFRNKIPGSNFAHTFNKLSPTAQYNISVQAISEAWTSGELASEIFQFPTSVHIPDSGAGGSFETAPNKSANQNELVLTNIQAEELGQKILVSWQLSGNPTNVRAYQVEQKLETDPDWRTASNYIANKPGQFAYREQFDHSTLINNNVQLRVRAIGSDGQAIAITDSISLSSTCKKIEQIPSDVSLIRLSADSAVLRWSYPNEPANNNDCGLYFVLGGTIDQVAIQQTVDGQSREHRFDGNTAKNWQLRVAAVNRLGQGPFSQIASIRNQPTESTQRQGNVAADPTPMLNKRTRRSICDPRTDFWCRPTDYSSNAGSISRGALITTPTISQSRDGSLQVEWRSTGNGRGVFGYRILFRTTNTGWNPFGQIVPYVGDNTDYQLILTGLLVGLPYQVQIQVLDRNSYVLYTSPDVSAQSSCQAPTHPPSNLALDAPDSRHVRATWTAPSQSTWHCNSIQYELQVDEPRGRAPVVIDGRQTSHVFDSEPDSTWIVRIRSVNPSGQSPWSTSLSTRSPPASELIEGPFVTNIQGVPRLSWKSREGSDPDLIDHFVVEWKTRTEQRWNSNRNKIAYSGWQRPYTLDLNDLPAGHTYEVRLKAIDANFGTAFVSPTITVQNARRQCSAPRSPPRGIEVSPIGPTQIRLSWQPLPETEWNCDRVWYVIKYSSPETQGYKNLTQGEIQAIFESKPFTQWQFEVQAANPAGSSAWSRAQNTQTFSSAPGPVSDLNVYPLSANSVQLSWRPPQNPNGQVSGYEVTYQLISRGMCDNVADRVITVFSERPSYTLTNLQPHSKYRIGVAARTTIAGERVTQEIQTEQSVPTAAPAFVRVDNVESSHAELSWHAPPCLQTNGDILEYEYEVGATPNNNNNNRLSASIPRLLERSRSTRIPLRNLIPGIKYSTKVRAFTSKGAGPWSTDVYFDTIAAAVVPTTLEDSTLAQVNPRIISTGPTDAHLIWQMNQQLAGYYDKFSCRYTQTGAQNYQEKQFPAYSPCDEELIRRKQLPPTTQQSQTHCGRIEGLTQDKSYDFEVKVKPKEQPWTPWSTPQRTFIGEQPIQIMSLVKQGGSSTTLRFVWTINSADQARCSGFRVTVVPRDRSEHPRIFNVDKNTLQYYVDGLKPNTVYSVTIEASTNNKFHQGLTVDMSTDVEQIFNIEQRPRIIEERSNSITIAWDVPSTIKCSSFLVEYRLDNGVWQNYERRIPCEQGHRTYTTTVANLPTNSAVDFRVVVISTQNQRSTPSPEARGHTKCSAPESPPPGLRVDAPLTNEVRASWSRPAKSTWNCDELNLDIGYRVGDQPEKIVTVPGDKTDHLFSSEPNSRWIVRVRSSNQMGSSPWSMEQTITTRQGAPEAVRNLQLTPISPNEIRVRWDSPLVQRGSIVGYDISYRLKHRLACPNEEPRDVSREYLTLYNHKDLDYTITGLLPNSLYEVKVRARTTELGPEEAKEAATLQQQPSSPPLNLELTYTLERSLSFQWEPVDCSQRHGEIVNYEYEIVGQDDWAKLERQIANTSETHITIDGLTPYTKYIMRVKAYNNIGGGPNTENLDVMTAKANAPLPPQDLVVTQEGTDFFVVSWLPPYPPYGPHDSYKLRYQLLNDNIWQQIEVNAKDRRLDCPAVGPRFCFNITGLENGQQYRVQVAARIEGGVYGPYSSAIIANTLQILPDAPQAIELIAKTDHSLHIRWIPPVDLHGHITQYRLTYASLAEPNSRKEIVIVNHPQLEYLIDNLQPETTYNISLSAGTKRGFGPEIWTRYTTDPFRVPALIAAPIVTPEGAHTLNVQWSGVSDAKNRIAGYIIEIRTSDNPTWTEYGGVVKHETGKNTYYSRLESLDSDTLYFVRIKVIDNRQRLSDASPEAHGRTGCATPLSPPTNINLQSPEWHQVKLSWQSPTKSSWLCSSIRYRIEFKNGSQPVKQVEVPSATNDYVLDSGPNTEWIIRLRTENDAGPSGWSNELKIKTAGGAPSEVNDLKAKNTGNGTAEATWRAPDEAGDEITGYTLVYQLKSIGECGPSSAKPITIQAKEERADLKDLIPDAIYEIHVTAHTQQEGPRSKIVTLKTEEAEPTGSPKNLRAQSVTATRAELVWNEIDCQLRHGKIIGYNYELEALSQWGRNTSQQTTTHRISLDDLAPFTQYRVRVRGQNNKGLGPFTEWIQFQTLPTAPPPPTDLREEELLPHALEISFLPPSPPNGVLDFYTIRHNPRDQFNYKESRIPAFQLECSDSANKGRLCYRIKNLEPEQDYEVQVKAHTERGDWSDWSESLYTKTEKQNIPVVEQGLELDFVKSNSIGVKWHGLEEKDAEHIIGYILEYKSENDLDWQEHNGVVRHRQRQNDYKAVVKNLIEATEYFFRLRVVGKNDKRGGPGPELKAITKCGKPEQPPNNVKIESVDFETIKFTWENPESDTWKCDQAELVLQYSNSTNQGIITLAVDGPQEYIFETVPGTRWDGKMRTQTVEDDSEPNHSKWSNRATLVTKPIPSEIFVKVIPKGPDRAEVNWDLPEDYQDWKYGVDISYKLIKQGGCKGPQINDQEPIVMENVQDRQVFLENLSPGSEYEVIVTLRRPPGLPETFPVKKTTRRFKTDDAIPTGMPQNLKVETRQDTKLGFAWEPPECVEQNGEISQYEYEIEGLDEWNKGSNEGISPRTKTDVTNLLPGSLYRFKVRAFTSAGPGPWSEPLDARTTGSEIGAPRELTAISTKANSIQLTWLPPYPETSTIEAYRIKYSPRTDDRNPVQTELSGDELTCSGFTSPIITKDNLCTTITGLKPLTTYRFAVQAQSSSGNWGPWSSDYFSTTRKDDDTNLGGSLKLLSAGHDNLKVKWVPPAVIGDNIDKYEVYISVATKLDQNPKQYSTPGAQTEYHFRGLEPVTQYNVTVQGLQQNTKLWFISSNFATTDKILGQLPWLTAPTDLHLIEKSDTMLHVTWTPPEIFESEYRDLLTHYRVTIAPIDSFTTQQGPSKNYTVQVPGNSIKFTELIPETIYNITVQGGTEIGYGERIWGIWSTLPTGQTHILRLKDRTPTTLTVEWEPVWGTAHKGYVLTAKALASIYSNVRLNTIRTFEVSPTATEFLIAGLDPATTYNVTLLLKDQNDGAWGVYSTLPPGWYLPKNLKHCDRTNYATSMSWEPVEHALATHYQIRYIHLNQQRTVWIEEAEKHRKYLLCPKDPCNRLCYLVFNLPNNPDEYAFQVRTRVDGIWNRWKTAARLTITEPIELKENCCIVPPPYHVDNIASPGTSWEVPVAPAATETNITRYFVVVDEQEPPGDTNFTQLTDKITANRRKIPYYVAASFNRETLTEPFNVKLGDGQVIGGYLNYPLVKGKTYNYEIYTHWNMTHGQPIYARIRPGPYLTSGWPWWWLLLLLLPLLLCILLSCLLLWCLQGRKRRRRFINGQHVPLLAEEKQERFDSRGKGDFEDGYSRGYRDAHGVGSAAAARRKLDDDFGGRDDRFHEGYAKGLRDAGLGGMTSSMSNLAQKPNNKLGYSSGYMQGFRDGNSGIFGDRVTNSLLKRLEEQYPNNDEFRQGYVDGFKDGVSGGRKFEDSRHLHKSLTELTERLTSLEKTKGDEIHSTKIYHVYNQHPELAGYSSTGERLTQELEEITSGSGTRSRSTLRRHYTPGDYLKYGSELDGYNSLSHNRRSLSASALGRESSEQRQRHTSGTSYISKASAMERQGTDIYSKKYNYRSRSDMGSPRRYASQTLLDGARPGPTTPHSRKDALQSLQRELDSLSRSPAGTSTAAAATGTATAANIGGYSSDTGYLESSSRAGSRHRANYDYDTFQSRISPTAAQQQRLEKQEQQQQQHVSSSSRVSGAGGNGITTTFETTTIGTTGGGSGGGGIIGGGESSYNRVNGGGVGGSTLSTDVVEFEDTPNHGKKEAYQASLLHHQQQQQRQQHNYNQQQQQHHWADDLIEIVNEPMNQTYDRMRRFSNSLSNVDKGLERESAGEKETIEEKYHKTYKEEYSSGSH